MLILPNNCQSGVFGHAIGEENRVLTSSYIYQPNPTHHQSADTSLSGSFCPRYTGTYNLYFEGKFGEIYDQYQYTFNNIIKHLNGSEKNVVLYSGQCYPFSINSPDIYSSFSKFSVEFENHERYIPSSSELITCNYTGCINGGNINNHCVLRENTCDSRNLYSFFHKISLFYMTLISISG